MNDVEETDFAVLVRRFFRTHLRSHNKVGANTVLTYRTAFKKLLAFFKQELGIPADDVSMDDFTRENIKAFYVWLAENEENSDSTINNRQATINSFTQFLLYEYPDYMDEYKKILSIKSRRVPDPHISYLKADGIKLLLGQVDLDDRDGLRDYLILAILLSTGMRVSELISIRVMDVSMSSPKSFLLHGKGNKIREVAIIKWTLPYLTKYMERYGLDRPEKGSRYLFVNHSGNQFTRQGINYIVKKYVKLARAEGCDVVASDISPHKLRHTSAMEFLDAGVSIFDIRDQLGHSSVRTTEIYVKANTERRKKVIEEASKKIFPRQEEEVPEWENNAGLLEFLESYGNRDRGDYVK